MRRLEPHRDAVERALTAAGVSWETWPGVAVDASLDAEAQLSALLLLLAAPPRPISDAKGVVRYDRSSEVIERLRRRRLPWTRATARLALELVRLRGEFDSTRVGTALRGAERVCASGEADVALLDELALCQAWLDDQPEGQWQLPQMRLLVRRVTAAAAPPDVLDLSLVRDGDAWAVPARESARARHADDIASLVRRLGELGARTPSQAWLRGVQDALRPVAAQELLESWLCLAADTDVVPRDGVDADSGLRLLAHGNEALVRAAVLATRLLPTEEWVPEVLGVLARRGAAAGGTTESLCLSVASAAVDTLVVRGAPADRAVLEQLLEDLSRRDLVKRIGAALGQVAEAAERDARLRREKAAAVRRKADPEPRRTRAEVDALLRRHLFPTLRRRGFRGSGRTWRRLHGDRVDVVSPGSSGDQIHLSYGTHFDAAHPDGEPFPVDRARIHDYHLDIRLFEDWEAHGPDLDDCARHLEELVVPFLDGLGRYELVHSHLEHGTGAPGAGGAIRPGGPSSPATDGLLGMLALAAGDRATAVDRLTRRLGFEQSSECQYGDQAAAVVHFWRAHLDRARRLPRPAS